MRRSAFLATAFALSATLSACGEGSAFDETFKTSYKEKFVQQCADSAKGSIPAGINIDATKLCGCAADKIMQGKSAKDLATTVPGSAEDMAKVQACLTELYPNISAGAPPK